MLHGNKGRSGFVDEDGRGRDRNDPVDAALQKVSARAERGILLKKTPEPPLPRHPVEASIAPRPSMIGGSKPGGAGKWEQAPDFGKVKHHAGVVAGTLLGNACRGSAGSWLCTLVVVDNSPQGCFTHHVLWRRSVDFRFGL